MNEQSNRLESRLAELRPRAMSAHLERRIAAALADANVHRGDRMLWSAIAGGALAACIIVAALIAEPRVRPSSDRIADTGTSKHAGNSTTALARSEQRWGDELVSNSNWSFR